jgi:hypothetical protein
MTQEDICALLIELGATEYPSRESKMRCFSARPLEGVPNCACNEKPPALHVLAYKDWTSLDFNGNVVNYIGAVEFKVFGEAENGRWLSATIYSVQRHEVEAILPSIKATAAAIWTAFANADSKQL